VGGKMAKTIYATRNDIYIHKSLTEILHLQDLVVIGQEFPTPRYFVVLPTGRMDN
jgi:hypothetical protein